eukprot:1140975-Pyramimonas_sp.AAC.1
MTWLGSWKAGVTAAQATWPGSPERRFSLAPLCVMGAPSASTKLEGSLAAAQPLQIRGEMQTG